MGKMILKADIPLSEPFHLIWRNIMAEYASKGVAGSGLGLGIAGTALGLLNGGFFNGFGGCLGGNGAAAMAVQGTYQVAISAKDAEIGQLKAERYADGVGVNTFKEALTAMDKRFDENRARIAALERLVAEGAVREEAMRGEIRLLRCQMQGAYVPGKLVMPADAICPEQMPRYNSWAVPTTPPKKPRKRRSRPLTTSLRRATATWTARSWTTSRTPGRSSAWLLAAITMR